MRRARTSELEAMREEARKLRAEARRLRDDLERKAAKRRERFYDRATEFAAAHHYFQRLIGKQPK